MDPRSWEGMVGVEPEPEDLIEVSPEPEDDDLPRDDLGLENF